MATLAKTPSAGRPRKYAEPSSPITVTLPDRILKRLEGIDGDRGKAIVKCVETQTTPDNGKGVHIMRATQNSSIIIVSSRRHLESIPWLRLVEIAPDRFLLAMPAGTDITSLEVALLDLLEHLPPDNDGERAMLEDLRQHLSHHRRKNNVTKGEILFVDL